jgi:hypothetical protein
MTAFLHALQRQPEYVHILINPLPIYGLAISWIGLVIAFFLRSRRAQIATLALVLISAARPGRRTNSARKVTIVSCR